MKLETKYAKAADIRDQKISTKSKGNEEFIIKGIPDKQNPPKVALIFVNFETLKMSLDLFSN
jgi:hypothetical protein